VNFLPFVAQIDPKAPFGQFIKATQNRLLDALEHQEFTYGRLIKKFNSDDRPVIEAVFNYERINDDLAIPGFTTGVAEIVRGYATNPLFLKARENEMGLEIRFDYHSSLFSEESVGQWIAIYRAILEGLIARADQSVDEVAASISPAQTAQLRAWNETTTDYPRDKSVPALFDEVAAERGASTALRSDAGEMSYSDLASRIDRIAHGLTAAGVKHGDRVALFLERSPHAIASLYAVMKCGATCVPLDPEYPLDRLHFLVTDSGASLAVCEASWMERLPKSLASFTPDHLARDGEGRGAFACAAVEADDAASILYTSGSTGTPKGALIPHRAMVRLVRNSDFLHFGEDETFLFAASPCFDASILEIHGALLNGGVLALPAPGQLNLDAITTALTKHQVSTVWLTAGLFQIMVEECPEAFAGLKQLITGGDVMSPAHATKVLALYPNLCLINGYGPTENTTFTTTHRVAEEDLHATSIPVGRAIANTTVFLLDSNLHPVQPGVPGELCTGGDGLALGYLNRPELSAESSPLFPANASTAPATSAASAPMDQSFSWDASITR
jgi:amino acid adenylation domain-containing protein